MEIGPTVAAMRWAHAKKGGRVWVRIACGTVLRASMVRICLRGFDRLRCDGHGLVGLNSWCVSQWIERRIFARVH